MKTCPKCKEEKTLEAFARCRAKSDGRQSWCRKCVKKRQASNVERVRDAQLWTKYRLRREDLLRMYEDQSGCCAVCLEARSLQKLHVDHCHIAGHVRGLLCPQCNLGLGQFRDSAWLLQSAMAYLESRSADG